MISFAPLASAVIMELVARKTSNTTQAALTGSAVLYAKIGVPITYGFGYASSGTAMQYELHIKVEAL